MNNKISSAIFIGHVRRASCGGVSTANTHPFSQAVHGATVVFAHNGTLSGLPQPNRFRPNGETDSERAFCLLLSWMEEEQVSLSDYPRIENWLRQLNHHGTMNVMFSNGTEFFAYRDVKGYNGLCLTYRKAPFPSIKLQDEDWAIDLSEEKKPSERGFIVTTKPLTGETWTDMKKGDLLVIRTGKALYGDPLVM
jgi:predicted glutamine amidotransferase